MNDYDPRDDPSLMDCIDAENMYVQGIAVPPQSYDDGDEQEEPDQQQTPVDNDDDYGFPEFDKKPVYRKVRKRSRKR